MACLRNLVGLLFDKCELFAVIDSMNLREGCSKPSIKVPISIIFVFWSMANQNMKIFEKLTDLHVLTPLRASNIQYFFFQYIQRWKHYFQDFDTKDWLTGIWEANFSCDLGFRH